MNEHIINYCENFIETSDNPEFAIFIKGDWGVGKTHFINKLLTKYNKDNKNNKSGIDESQIIKISLFGVSSFDNIDSKIYQAIHPVLSSEGMKIVGAVARTAVKLGTNIDFNGDGKSDASLSFGGISSLKSKKIKNISKKLLIVDDLERALLSPSEVFGYFSDIISDSTTKIIFIGNEDKISEHNEEKRKEYFKIKEKTIGIEFEIEPEKEEAIKSFISKLGFTESEFFEKKTIQIINLLGCTNLRVVWQGLYNLKILVNYLDEDLDDLDKEKIFEIFLILYFQKTLNKIGKDSDINDILTGYFKYNKSYDEYIKYREKKTKELQYFFPDLLDNIPLLDAWKKIIFDGYYNKDWIVSIYRKEKDELSLIHKSKEKEISDLFKLIGNWRNLDSVEFKTLYEKVKQEFSEGKYLHPGEILLYQNYFIVFSKWELIPETIQQLQDELEKFLNANKQKIIPLQDWYMIDIGYGGYAFSDDIEQIRELKKTLKKINDENYSENSKRDIKREINNLDRNYDEFIKNIIHVNGNNKYYKQPILSFLNINEFYDKLKSLPLEKQENIVNAFTERYGMSYGNEPFTVEYSADLDNLKILRDLYKCKNLDVTFDPHKFFEKNIEKKLDELVVYVERKTNELRNNN